LVWNQRRPAGETVEGKAMGKGGGRGHAINLCPVEPWKGARQSTRVAEAEGVGWFQGEGTQGEKKTRPKNPIEGEVRGEKKTDRNAIKAGPKEIFTNQKSAWGGGKKTLCPWGRREQKDTLPGPKTGRGMKNPRPKKCQRRRRSEAPPKGGFERKKRRRRQKSF